MNTSIAVPESGAIPRSLTLPRSQNYAYLRARGLRHIEQYAHKVWTDYNVHDPGITLLELLCYAITELGMRAAFPIQDLLAESAKALQAAGRASDFHQAHEVLVCRPVSFDDMRRLLIDIPGVRNAWIERHRGLTYHLDTRRKELSNDETDTTIELNGLFDVYLEYEDQVVELPEPQRTERKRDVRAAAVERIHVNRNLCEDVLNVCDLNPEEVAVCADIELRPDADTESVHAEILYRLLHHVSPMVPFHSLDEMLAMGHSVDEIFEGPLLGHGFIDEAEMQAIRRKCEIRASDVVQIIMDVEGVLAVKSLVLLSFIDGVLRGRADWQLTLSQDRFRVASFAPWRSKLIFYKRGLPYYANQAVVKALYKDKKAADIDAKLKTATHALDLPAGQARSAAAYLPVQYELPIAYCVGRIRVPPSQPLRQAQSRQLKAYLMFFEQILANYLAQLGNVGELFTWRDVDIRTYFTQQVPDIVDFDDLDDSAAHGYASFFEALEDIVETMATAEDRRLRFLQHLAARYAEVFEEYTALMRARGGDDLGARLIGHVRRFLDDYPSVGASRGGAFDYRWPTQAGNISGFERRIYRLLDIEPVSRRHLAGHRFVILNAGTTDNPSWLFEVRDEEGTTALFRSIPCKSKAAIESLLDLALRLGGEPDNYQPSGGIHELVQHCEDDTEPSGLGRTTTAEALDEVVAYFKQYGESEGFRLIEHILLRKRTLNDPFLPVELDTEESADGSHVCTCPPVRDPYSFRVSIVLPAWPPRFRDIRFRRLVEDTLRRETPAHVFPRICWVGHEQMREFEAALDDWESRLAEIAREPASCSEDDGTTRTGQLLRRARRRADRNHTDSLTTLVERLYGLTNVYPLAQLHDCEEVSGDTPQITLGHTSLGTL